MSAGTPSSANEPAGFVESAESLELVRLQLRCGGNRQG